MNLETFKQIVKQHEDINKLVKDAYKINIGPEFFDIFYALSETLMNEIFYNLYTQTGVDYILFEWLYCNNRSPLEVTTNGEAKKYALETVEDVYNALESDFKLSK